MKDELVTFETAKLAKEKGFDESCSYYIDSRFPTLHCTGDLDEQNIHPSLDYKAPTQSLLQRWLREQHMIYISVDPETIGSDEWEWTYKIQHLPKEHREVKRRCGHFVYKSSYNESPGGTYWGAWRTYEEALEIGLKDGLSLISGDNPNQ